MRILYLHPRSWSGEYSILVKLRDLGHDVCVLEERRGLEGGSRQIAADFQPGDRIRTMWYDPRRGFERVLTWPLDRVFRKAFDGRNLVHRMPVIAAAVREFAPDVIVCSDGFTYGIPAAFMKRLGLLQPRLIVSYIGGDVLDCPEADVGKRRTPMVTWLIRQSVRAPDVLRPVSPLVAEALAAEGVAAARMAIVPSHLVADTTALDALWGKRQALRRDLCARYGIDSDAPLIATLGGNQKGKGLHVLARAWPGVLRELPGARWLLCGPPTPWLESNVWPVLKNAGIAESVIATGQLDGMQVFERLAAVDLHVNASLCESLNMASVEAAAVGTPTITTDGAGIAHWIARYGAGRVVPAGNSELLAADIISALRNTSDLAQWSAAGRTMASEFALDRVAAQMLALMAGSPATTSQDNQKIRRA